MSPIETNETHANVDQSEIAKFERMASGWWDTEGEFKPLHDINPLRANYIDGIAPVAERQLLDLGCGGGILAEAMAQRGATTTGIDMGEQPLAVAKLHALEQGLTIDYRQATAEDFANQHPNQFDIVCCLEMLEHVPDPASVIAACAKLVKPGGDIFLSTINRTPKAYGLAVIGAEYILKWLPRGTHDYNKFIRPAQCASWARHANLTVKDIKGMVYNPLTRQYSLSKTDVDVNYIVHLRKSKTGAD